MANNVIALEFLSSVANESSSHTRVSVALRGINFTLTLLVIPSLSGDPRTPLLLKGVHKMFDRNPRGANPFPEVAVVTISQE